MWSNGAWWGCTKHWHGVVRRVKFSRNISVRQVLVEEPKFCLVDTGVRHKISAHQLLVGQRSDAQWL